MIRGIIDEKWRQNAVRDAARLRAQAVPQGVEVREGLAYLPGGHPMHTLNLYRPEGASGPLPTVVDIHGGGWMYGDRGLNRNYCMALAAQGYAVMGMSYRLLPETDLQGQVQDVFASLHWLEDHGRSTALTCPASSWPGTPPGGIWPGWPPASRRAAPFRPCTGWSP